MFLSILYSFANVLRHSVRTKIQSQFACVSCQGLGAPGSGPMVAIAHVVYSVHWIPCLGRVTFQAVVPAGRHPSTGEGDLTLAGGVDFCRSDTVYGGEYLQ